LLATHGETRKPFGDADRLGPEEVMIYSDHVSWLSGFRSVLSTLLHLV